MLDGSIDAGSRQVRSFVRAGTAPSDDAAQDARDDVYMYTAYRMLRKVMQVMMRHAVG